MTYKITDSTVINRLITQPFDNARAPGQLGGRAVQMGQAQGPRAQPSESGFANKAKNLLDRAVTYVRSNSEQRAEAGIARGVQNFDKAFGKLMDAMKPDDTYGVDFAKLCRRLDALPGSAKSATSRGVDYNALLEKRFKQYAAESDPQTLKSAHENIRSALQQLEWEQVRAKTPSERQPLGARLTQLENLRDLSDQVRFGMNADQLTSFRRAGGMPEEIPTFKDAGFSIDQMVGFRQTGGKAEDIAAFKQEGFNIDQMVSFRQAGGKPEDIAEFKKEGFSADQMVNFRRAGGKLEDIAEFKKEGFTDSEIKLYAGFTLDKAKSLRAEYQRLNISVNDKTIIRDFKAENLQGNMVEFGKGEINKVYQGVYKVSDGSLFTGIFKPEKSPDLSRQIALKIGNAAAYSGIDSFDPQLGGRNIASSILNDSLGFKVIPRTGFGTNGNNAVGTVMAKANGLAGRDSPPALFDDPAVRRELTKLQWLDGLTAQVDRHPGNYLIEAHPDGSGKQVIGIDNDASFGDKITHPNQIALGKGWLKGVLRGLRLPPVIDTDMARAFRELTPEKLQASLNGLMTQNEIDATKKRLIGIQEHIDALEKAGRFEAGRFINPDQWGSKEVGNRLNDPTNSYVARDKKIAARKF